MVAVNVGNAADPVVTRLVREDKVPWYKKPNLRMLYFTLFFTCMGVEMTSGFDSQLINTLQYTPHYLEYFGNGYQEWNAADQKMKFAIEPSLLGFMSACYQLGSIFGVPIVPWFANRYGRRWSIMLGSLIMVFGAIIQGASQHVGMYIVSRMILGFGIIFAIVSGSSLIGELAHPKERAVMTSLFNSSYFIGQITASAIAIGMEQVKGQWAWRIPSLLQICPSLLQICFVFMLPESPRFLMSHDREEEAAAIFVKYHAEGDADSLLVKAEIAQVRETIKTEMEASQMSWMALIKAPGMRRRMYITLFLGLFTQLSGNTLLGYYSSILFDMMGYTTQYAKSRINVANACWSFINATILALVITRFPRRVMYMISAGSMLCVFIGITVSLQALQVAQAAKVKNAAAGIASLFFYFAYSPCYNMGNNALTYTYLVELWPYSHRSRGISIQQLFGKIAGFFSMFVNPIALDAIAWKFLAIYCGWIAFEFCVIFALYPETSNRTLEELAFLFEADEYNQKVAAATEKRIAYGDDEQAIPQEKLA